jgi:hypothetical protein
LADRPKVRPGSAPFGAFSSKHKPTEEIPPGAHTKTTPKPPRPEPPSKGATPISIPAHPVTPPKSRRHPSSPNQSKSSFPPPLGVSEEHDAWTLEHVQRQSTVPPVRTEEVDRLREISAHSEDSQPPAEDGTRGGALDLVDRSRPSERLDLIDEMEELYALDDLTGALRMAELVLGREPDNMQAQRCADNCRRRLIGLYASKVGDLTGVPRPLLSDAELRWLGLDHRSGFLLSRIDGACSIEELLDVCGMPRLEALKTLADLLDRGAIEIERR